MSELGRSVRQSSRKLEKLKSVRRDAAAEAHSGLRLRHWKHRTMLRLSQCSRSCFPFLHRIPQDNRPLKLPSSTKNTDDVGALVWSKTPSTDRGDVLIDVWFRPCIETGNLGDLVYRRMAAIFLGQLRMDQSGATEFLRMSSSSPSSFYTGSYMRSQWEDIVWVQKQRGLIPADRDPCPHQTQ